MAKPEPEANKSPAPEGESEGRFRALVAGSLTCMALILGLVSARRDLRAADL